MELTFQQWLGEQMLKHGLRQVDVAEGVGTTQQAVSNWLVGVRKPAARQIEVLAKVFKVSEEEVRRVVRPETN